MNQNKSNKFFNLVFFWISITIIYTFLLLFHLSQVASLIGLFVPLGFYSIFVLASSPLMWIISLILVLLVIFGLNNFFNKQILNPILKIIAILLTLFILTVLVDFILYGRFESLYFLKDGGQIHLNNL